MKPSIVPFAPQFQENDRWCAIGDSITHGGWYHSYIHLYYATRFPKKKLELFNCGVNGDSASRVLARLDDDVLVHRPTVVSVLLGMNDVCRDLYAPGGMGTDVDEKRVRAFATFRHDLRTLLSRVQRTGAGIIVVTPTIYDNTLVYCNAEANYPGLNSALGRCGEIAIELAAEFGATSINLHDPMTELNARLQKTNPEFTLVGLDRVHPGEVGHFVMMYEFLKAQRLSLPVSEVVLNAQSGGILELTGCNVDNVRIGSGSLDFNCLETALPFPVPPSCLEALEFLPFTKEFNEEILRVGRLNPGAYELQIDGKVINSYTAEQLSQGVNLAMEPMTPQFQQAQEVLALSARRTALYGSRLRCIAENEWGFLFGSNVDRGDLKAVKEVLDAKCDGERNQPWYEFCKSQGVLYMESKPHEAEYWVEISSLSDEIYRKNVPVRHHYRLSRNHS